MCSVSEDIEELSRYRSGVSNNFKRNVTKCKKCEEKPFVLLQKKDPFCKKCFLEYCDHKFRSTIGKTKKVKHGDKILLACSGGRKSTALLHLTKKALDAASAKQISFIPALLFIDESEVAPSSFQERKDILTELLAFGYPVYYATLEMAFQLNNGSDFYHQLLNVDMLGTFNSSSDISSRLNESVDSMTLSTKLDYIKHLKLLLMTEIAHAAGYKYVFVGDTACYLASNLLTDISLGRGSQISSDTNFLDSRYKAPLCRPLREFLNKEVVFYNHLNKCLYFVLPDLLTKTDVNSSIQRLTEAFITNLQEDFPATVFTIFRTGGKLLKQKDGIDIETCVLCRSKLDNLSPDPCSAIEALKLSQKLSQALFVDIKSPVSTVKENESSSLEHASQENIDILRYLCHGCSMPFRNKDRNTNLIPLFQKSFVKMKREEMKEEIKEYLL